ncbi:MAG: META domain-containing protein [Geminicoccaceae bacterium]
MRSPASLLGLALAALAASPAAADIRSECWEGSAAEFSACLEAAESEADAALAAVVAVFREEQAAASVGQRAEWAFRRAQQAFELFRDLDCEVVGLQSQGLEAIDARRACWVDHTRERIQVLETLMTEMPTGPMAHRYEDRIEGGPWLVEDIQARGVMDYLQTTLQVSSGGGVSGFGGCNRYFGEAEIDGDKIRFGALGSTRMACPEAIMDQESRFFAALELVRFWRVEPTGLLHLLDKDGTTIIRLSR